MNILEAIERHKEGRRIRDLCERFRKGMAAAGEHKQASLSDDAILVGLKELVEQRPQSRGRSAEEIVAATIKTLEGAVYAMENPPASPRVRSKKKRRKKRG